MKINIEELKLHAHIIVTENEYLNILWVYILFFSIHNPQSACFFGEFTRYVKVAWWNKQPCPPGLLGFLYFDVQI